MPAALDIELLLAAQGDPRAWKPEPEVEESIQAALDASPPPRPRGFAQAGRAIIAAIHALPGLYTGSLGTRHFEVYLGRCGATAQHLFGRFRAHGASDGRGHEGGMALLECPNEDITHWETAGIRFIKGLHERGRLCVANLSAHGGGKLPESVDSSYIYITWRRLGGRKAVRIPTAADVRALVPVVADALGTRVTPALRDALGTVAQPQQHVAEAHWAEGHDA